MNQVEGVNCVFVEGVDSRRLDLDELKRQNLIEAGTTFRLPGIALAHRNLWLKAASMQKALIVCEDDAVLRKDFHNQLARCLSTLPDDWKFLLLGYNFDSLLDVYIIDRVEHFEGQFSNRSLGVSELRSYQDVRLPVGTLRLRNAFGAPGYAVSPNGAQFLIANVFPLRNRPVTIRGRTCVTSTMDALLNGLYAEMRAYVCVPPLVVTPNEKDPTVRTVRVA